MPRRRRSRSVRSYRPLKTMKYSNETVSGSFIWDSTGIGDATLSRPFPIINPSDVFGTRKAKNFTIKVSLQSSQTTTGQAVCALLYLPEGLNLENTTPLRSGTLPGTDKAAVSLYEPAQNVITSWVMNYDTTTPVTISSRLARNLNSGDSIWLVIRPLVAIDSGETLQFVYTCNFALGYN